MAYIFCLLLLGQQSISDLDVDHMVHKVVLERNPLDEVLVRSGCDFVVLVLPSHQTTVAEGSLPRAVRFSHIQPLFHCTDATY